MITPIPHARRMNLIALALFITALVALAAFHVLPGFLVEGDEVLPGWAMWTILPELVAEMPGEPLMMIIFASFIASAFLVLACPFVAGILRRSRISWWTVTISSGAAFFGLGGILLYHLALDPSLSSSGINCLAAAQMLNFLGLLFIRREMPAAPEVDSA